MKILTKKCTTCKIEYPHTAEYFCRHARYKSGLTSRCKQCDRNYAIAHRAEPETKQKLKLYKQIHLEEHKKYIQDHAKEINEKRVLKYATDSKYRIKILSEHKKYRESHKNDIVYIEKRRNAANLLARKLTDGYVRSRIVSKQKGLCANDIPQYLIELKRKQLKLKRDVTKKQCRKSQT